MNLISTLPLFLTNQSSEFSFWDEDEEDEHDEKVPAADFKWRQEKEVAMSYLGELRATAVKKETTKDS